MQASPYHQAALPKAKRTNCLKPIVGCVFGPVLAVGLVLGCALACLSALTLRGPQPPLGKNYEPDPTAAAQYEQSVINSLRQSVSTNGTFTIQMEDRALSAWLNTEYKTLFETYDIPQPFLWEQSEPQFQIRFDDDQILFYVENQIPLLTLNAMLTAEVKPPSTDLTIYLVAVDILKIESMGFSIEDDSATISAWIAQLLTAQIEEYQLEAGLENVEITGVSAQDGNLTLSGQVVVN